MLQGGPMALRPRHLVRTALVAIVGLIGAALWAVPAGAVGPVTTPAALAAAWANPNAGVIDIGADIALCPGVQRTSNIPVIVDGHGHTVRATCPTDLFVQNGTGGVAFTNIVLRDIPTDETDETGHAVRSSGDVLLYKTQVLHTQGIGGAAVSGDEVFVLTSKFQDNTMVGDFGRWGAVRGRAVYAQGSTFLDNSGRFGATAIDADESLTVDFSRFERNFASGTGAGALASNGHLVITRSVFVDNGTGASLGGVVS